MMAALVRVEFFTVPSEFEVLPNPVVMNRIFAHPEPARLNIFYQGERVGFCRVEIAKLQEPDGDEMTVEDIEASKKPGAYRLRLDFTMYEQAMRIRIAGEGVFNRRYEILKFSARSRFGDAQVDVKGDDQSRKVQTVFTMGQRRETREFDFDQMKGTGLSGAIGLSGFSGATLPNSADGGLGPESLVTRTQLDQLQVGESKLRTYRVETRLNENLWAKMWVSQLGEVLRVDTSVGLTMLADSLSGEDKPRRRIRPAALTSPEQPTNTSDDSNGTADQAVR